MAVAGVEVAVVALTEVVLQGRAAAVQPVRPIITVVGVSDVQIAETIEIRPKGARKLKLTRPVKEIEIGIGPVETALPR
jgi:hypothetical protein